MIKFFKNILKKILSFYNLKLINISNQDAIVFPIEADDNIKKFINISNQFSMCGKKNMYLLSQAILNTKYKKLDGDFVECGVWRGGNILLYKLLNDFYDMDKTIYAYDTFDGMTNPESVDKNYKGIPAIEYMKSQQKSEDKQNIHA